MEKRKLRWLLKRLGVSNMGSWVTQVRDYNYLTTLAMYGAYQVTVCYGRHRSDNSQSAGVYIGESCIMSISWEVDKWECTIQLAEWLRGEKM
jgi:hypothetical protein